MSRPGSNVAVVQPTLPQILRVAITTAPAEMKRGLMTGLVAWLTVMGLQALQSANDSGPAAVAEFLSALCGSAGGVLLVTTGLLNSSAEKRAGEKRSGAELEGYRRVLLALPAVGLVAGTLLSAAVALMLVRAMLGTELSFVIIITGTYGVLLVFAASTVMRATRVLYAHAQYEAQSALQARMNPHFLFNALNTVAALVRTQPAVAERVTENLSDVLRMTLDRSAERTTTVAEEVMYLRSWLAVEQERWQERLRIDWDIEERAGSAAIPPFLLQPLVENALRHGIGARMEGGTISISARRDGAHLMLRVADDGVGFPAAHAERTGIGNLRQRLSTVYGDAANLTIELLAAGAAVIIRVPYEEADARADRR